VNRSKLIRYAAIGAGVLVVVAVGVAAFLSMQQPFQLPNSSVPTTSCTPQPCADVRGFTLWVADVKVDAGLVSMTLTFRNSSNSTHADPSEIQLIAGDGAPINRVTDPPGCTAWPRTEFNNGATFGPVPECFRPATTTPPLRLHWLPDFGFFCCETDIPLTP
jgi:hypothetical protein